MILEEEKDALESSEEESKEYLEFGIYLLKNIDSFFSRGSLNTKQRLLGSILEEKLVFDGEKYRTPQFKPAFNYIYQNINSLERTKTKNGTNFSTLSQDVPWAGLELFTKSY